MVIAAGVTTAIIVLGVNALAPAGADESSRDPAGSELVDRFADCMRDRGVAIPELRGAALDAWLDDARLPIADARACKTALADVAEKAGAAADARKLKQAEAAKLEACGEGKIERKQRDH
jgi:hypothetical protein